MTNEQQEAYLQEGFKRVRTNVYFHIGFANYKTWKMSVFSLTETTPTFCEETEENKKYLQAVEFEGDEDMSELLHGQSMEVDDLLEASNSVQTLIHFLKSNIEFRVEYSAQFWTLENKSTEFLREAQMIPNTVEIKAMEGIPTIAKVWRGSTEEAKAHSKEIGKGSGMWEQQPWS